MDDRWEILSGANRTQQSHWRKIKGFFRKIYVQNATVKAGCWGRSVAAELGFQELSSFSRWFQHRAACSPKAFQARFRAEV
jgi:hypothetical protein